MQNQSFLKSFIVYGILAAGLALPAVSPAQTPSQKPYWDNSSSSSPPPSAPPSSDGSGSFYSPGSSSAPGNPGNPPDNGSFYGANQSGYGQQNYGPSQQQLRGYVATAPAGTTMSVTTTTYLGSDTSHIGDPISVTLGGDIASGGVVILPAGTQIQGEVASAVPAGRLDKNGQLQLRFTRATTPDGRTFPLSARVITKDGSGIIRGGTTGGTVGNAAKNTLGGAAIGGLGGTALGALSGGRPLQGLLWGSVLGGGAGLVKTGFDKGSEAKIQPGQPMQIMLDQPLSTSAASGGGYQNGGYPGGGGYQGGGYPNNGGYSNGSGY